MTDNNHVCQLGRDTSTTNDNDRDGWTVGERRTGCRSFIKLSLVLFVPTDTCDTNYREVHTQVETLNIACVCDLMVHVFFQCI